MAKKKQKQTEEEVPVETPVEETKEKMSEEKYALVDLVINCSYELPWIIYNLSRKGLLEQYEKEVKEYGVREITPTLTIDEFEKIIKGEQ